MSEIDTFQGICRRHPSTAVGNVWIYSIYQPNYNKNTSVDPYCNKTLYLFAFWTTTLVYILLGNVWINLIYEPNYKKTR